MPYIVCVEENEGRWIAHVPDLPGCYFTHKDRDQAIQAIPAAVEAYVSWCKDHGLRVSGLSEPMIVAEVIRSWESEAGYEVNAFFASDRPPLVEEELPQFEHLLTATRKDLMTEVRGLDADSLARDFPNERWSIRGILKHVARAEWWYLDRLGLVFPSDKLIQEPFACLEQVRKFMLSNVSALVKQSGVMTLVGETWTSRKVLRRALWHERDHTEHIRKLRKKMPRW